MEVVHLLAPDGLPYCWYGIIKSKTVVNSTTNRDKATCEVCLHESGQL